MVAQDDALPRPSSTRTPDTSWSASLRPPRLDAVEACHHPITVFPPLATVIARESSQEVRRGCAARRLSMAKSKSPLVAMKVPTPGDVSGLRRWPTRSRPCLLHPVGVARRDDRHRVVEQAVEQRHRGGVLGQEAAPGLERPVGRDSQAAALVGGGHEPEQVLGADIVEGREPEVVRRSRGRPAGGPSMSRPTLLSASPVERLREGGRGEGRGPGSRPRRRHGRARSTYVTSLFRLGAHERGSRGPWYATRARRGSRTWAGGWRTRRREPVERLGNREPGHPPPCSGVRGFAAAELCLEQRPQQLVGRPALDPRVDEDLGAPGAAWRRA